MTKADRSLSDQSLKKSIDLLPQLKVLLIAISTFFFILFHFILFYFILFYFILRHSFCSIYLVNFYLISKIAFYYYSILSIFMWISFPSDKASLPTLNLLLHFYQFYLRITLLQSVEIKNNKLLISSFLSINIINRLY